MCIHCTLNKYVRWKRMVSQNNSTEEIYASWKNLRDINNEYSRRMQQIEKLCENYANVIQDGNATDTMMIAYLIHLRKVACGVV